MTFITLGLMTGTSMDGIDAALLETDGKQHIKRLGGATLDFDRPFHLALRLAEYAVQKEEGDIKTAELNFQQHLKDYLKHALKNVDLEKILKKSIDLDAHEPITLAAITRKLTHLHADLINTLLQQTSLRPEAIRVIGFHGQNLYHHPSKKITLQIGEGQLLADLTKIPVINNFRENDVLHEGQGAPFAPLYHQALSVQTGHYPLAVVNCGGISNLTLIYGPDPDDVIGFDTGPGNVLLDRYIRTKTNNEQFMDKDGQYGSKGQINEDVFLALRIHSLKDHPEDFYNKRPPKSLDTQHFNLIPELETLTIEDACATLEAFTALTIVESLNLVSRSAPRTWVLAGGGWNNPVITYYLKQALYDRLGENITVITANEFGWDSKTMEAEIFAYLAARSLLNLPTSYPSTTGVSQPIVGGRLYEPKDTLEATP